MKASLGFARGAGTMQSLDARKRFWDGVQRAIVRYRQPNMIRQDGEAPRTVLGEILTLVWDRSPARSVEDWIRGRAARDRPAIDVLLANGRALRPLKRHGWFARHVS